MIKQILLSLIFAVWLWQGEKTAVAYKEETTHAALTLQTLWLLDPEAYREIHGYRDRLLTGVKAEDQFPRFNLHFYDPLTGLGLPRNSYTDFVEKGAFGGRLLLGELQPTNIRAPKGPGLRYMNALEWGRSEMPDDLDWEGAIWVYDYTESARERAYEAVGHVLHLLQDMGQPDHVQNRPHPGNDPRVHQFFASIGPLELNRVGYEGLWSRWSGQWPHGKQPERLTSLEEAFRKLAEESKQAEHGLGLPLKGEMALGLGPWPWALGGKPQFFPGGTILDLLDVEVKRRRFRDNLWAKYERKTLRLPRCLRRGGMSDLGRGLDARCQDQLEGLQWRHGSPTHTPCRLRYPVPLGLVAQVSARRLARQGPTAGTGALCRYCGAV